MSLEHIRKASSFEQLASGEWDSVIQEVIDAANRDQEWEMVDRPPPPDQQAPIEEPPPTMEDDGPRLSEQQAHPEPLGGPSNSDSSFYDGSRLSEQQAHPEPGGPVS